MKTIFYTICFTLLITSAFGQSKMKTIKFEAKSEVQSFSQTIAVDGVYSAQIVNPNGAVVSSPVHNKEYQAGEQLVFKYDPKYFQSGQYEIIISNDRQQVSRASIVVESNRLQKLRLEKEKYQKKEKKKQ